jgi:preprotein translocase subunit SecE
MNNSNSKIVTISFLFFAALVGFTISTLLNVLSVAFGVVARAMSMDLFRHGLPVALALGLFIYLQFNKNILAWADEVIAEAKKIVWPPVKDTRGMTLVVVIMVFVSSIIVSVFDMFSGFILNYLMK